jgi:hypothetical protein
VKKGVLSLLILFSASAPIFAGPLYYDTEGVVGTVSGLAATTPSIEAGFAQFLLDMTVGSVPVVIDERTYTVSSNEYSGIIGDSKKIDVSGTSAVTIEDGWQYVLAKYDGKNGGYVLFNIEDFGNVLPQYSYTFWGKTPEQYAISHYTLYKASTVPDGGLTVLLLGIGVGGAALFSRKFRK